MCRPHPCTGSRVGHLGIAADAVASRWQGAPVPNYVHSAFPLSPESKTIVANVVGVGHSLPGSSERMQVVRRRARRRCGREAEGGGLLNRYRVVKPYRGFESLRLRHRRRSSLKSDKVMMVSVNKLSFLGVLGLGFLGLSQAIASEDPAGYWATEKNESQIHITHCGDKLCGNIFWMKEPTDGKGALRLDKENEDEVKRKRTLLGLQLISMKPEDDYWKGTVYNPQNGKTYDATLKILSKTQVELKGCVAYILCGGQKWTREEPKTVNTVDSGAAKPVVAHPDASHPVAAPTAHKISAPAVGAPTPSE